MPTITLTIGLRGYGTLVEVGPDGFPTGNTKPNSLGDPDYIAPSPHPDCAYLGEVEDIPEPQDQ